MPSEIFSRLNRCKLIVKTKSKGIHRGTRQSRTIGTSFDFSDFRNYYPGDDIRQIDWNAYGRTEKLYIKRFLDEQEISVAVYLDSSKSMTAYEKKWKRAKELAAAFSYITLINDDRLTFVSAGSAPSPPINRKGSLYSKHLYYHINTLETSEENQSFTASVERHLRKHAQLCIIITDGLEELSRFETLFKRMAPQNKQIRFIHLLSKEEVQPSFVNDLKLIDIEDHSFVNVSFSGKIQEIYREKLSKHNQALSVLCKRYGISYMQVTDEDSLQTILLTNCVKNGWLEGR